MNEHYTYSSCLVASNWNIRATSNQRTQHTHTSNNNKNRKHKRSRRRGKNKRKRSPHIHVCHLPCILYGIWCDSKRYCALYVRFFVKILHQTFMLGRCYIYPIAIDIVKCFRYMRLVFIGIDVYKNITLLQYAME